MINDYFERLLSPLNSQISVICDQVGDLPDIVV